MKSVLVVVPTKSVQSVESADTESAADIIPTKSREWVVYFAIVKRVIRGEFRKIGEGNIYQNYFCFRDCSIRCMDFLSSSISTCCCCMMSCCSFIASMIGAMRLAYCTDLIPLVSVCTILGNIFSISWAITQISDLPSDIQSKLYPCNERIFPREPVSGYMFFFRVLSDDVTNDVAKIFPLTSSF